MFNGARQLTIDADLSSQGSFTNPITFEVTMAPSNIFSTSLFGANPSDHPSTLELTGFGVVFATATTSTADAGGK